MFSLLSLTFNESEREKIYQKIESYLKTDDLIRSFPFYETIDYLFNNINI
jgi:hypothetical protein